VDTPETYGLPSKPKLASRNLWPSSAFSVVGALAIGALGFLGFRQRRMNGGNGQSAIGNGDTRAGA